MNPPVGTAFMPPGPPVDPRQVEEEVGLDVGTEPGAGLGGYPGMDGDIRIISREIYQGKTFDDWDDMEANVRRLARKAGFKVVKVSKKEAPLSFCRTVSGWRGVSCRPLCLSAVLTRSPPFDHSTRKNNKSAVGSLRIVCECIALLAILSSCRFVSTLHLVMLPLCRAWDLGSCFFAHFGQRGAKKLFSSFDESCHIHT